MNDIFDMTWYDTSSIIMTIFFFLFTLKVALFFIIYFSSVFFFFFKITNWFHHILLYKPYIFYIIIIIIVIYLLLRNVLFKWWNISWLWWIFLLLYKLIFSFMSIWKYIVYNMTTIYLNMMKKKHNFLNHKKTKWFIFCFVMKNCNKVKKKKLFSWLYICVHG